MEKSHMVILIDAEKPSDKTQHPFIIKIPGTLRIEGKLLNMIKDIYENPTANSILNDK